MVGVSSVLGTNLVAMALFTIAAISDWAGPMITLSRLLAAIFILPEVYGYEHD